MGMMKSTDLLRELVARLSPKYGHEAQSMALILLEDILQFSRNDILLNTPVDITPAMETKVDESIKQLNDEVPIQHITGWAEFYGYRFKVNRDVLIPRLETEELVNLISAIIRAKGYSSLIDIGTGSGCIAITLALENHDLVTTAIDVSNEALKIARENALALGTQINFLHHDILQADPPGAYDVVVSNPPYVTLSERDKLPGNVLHHDPDLALFVSDEHPLIYYERIADMAMTQLNHKGLLAFEINEQFGSAMVNLLKVRGFNNITLKHDLNNKPRFVIGYKN
jgi:release factor glutamine methyltransferase